MESQLIHQQKGKWKVFNQTPSFVSGKAQLLLVFGAPECIDSPDFFNKVRKDFPSAYIVLSSTSGEILGSDVFDQSAVIIALDFAKTRVRPALTNIKSHENSFAAGKHLFEELNAEDLHSIFVISDGKYINGSELVVGLNINNSKNLPITGGLAGDAARFSRTLVGLDEIPGEGNVVAVGFYGTSLKIGHGSFGGWDEFGHERQITRSEKNVLFEIDGRNALELYKEYLGPYAEELPGSALLFPLSLKMNGSAETVVRTILAIDEKNQSMTFAGNMPEGSRVRLMKANFDKLIDGSSSAARLTFSELNKEPPGLAILISCVGRKLILQERTYEEVEAAGKIFGVGTQIAGFYSYGELSPLNPGGDCQLHNQTMTITTFSE